MLSHSAMTWAPIIYRKKKNHCLTLGPSRGALLVGAEDRERSLQLRPGGIKLGAWVGPR